MSWNDIWKIVFGVIAGFGGISGALCLVIKFSAETIAKRLEEKYTLKLNKELEKYKSDLDSKTYITKSKFDVEFSIYRGLSKKFYNMALAIQVMIPAGLTQVAANKEKRKENDENNYREALQAVGAAQDELHENIPFITEDVFNKYNSILRLARIQLHVFSERWNVAYLAPQAEKERLDIEDHKRTKQIFDELHQLNKEIRDYLSQLDILE